MPDTDVLSEREIDVLRLVATGASNKEIARDLSISQNTVKVHLRNIFSKTGVSSRTEAAMLAVQTGIADPASVPMNNTGLATHSRQGLLDWSRRSRRQKVGIFSGVFFLGLVVLAVGIGIYFAGTLGAVSGSDLGSQAVSQPRWSGKTPLPDGRTGLALAAYNNQIYAIGGETANAVVGEADRFDPASSEWISIRSKPIPVTDVMAVTIGGRIFIPGGRLVDDSLTDVLEIYNPALDTWEQGAPLPQPLSAYSIVAFEGRLYVFGGWDGLNFTNSTYRYDPVSDGWEVLAPMPTARGFTGAAEAGGRIFVVGGTAGNGPLRVNEEYTPANELDGLNPWKTAISPPEGRYSMGLTSVAGIIHMVGGVGETQESLPYKFFPQDEKWEAFEPFGPNDWTGLGLVPVETSIHAIGGNVAGKPVDEHLAYIAVYTISFPVFP